MSMRRPVLPVDAPPDPGASQPDELAHDGVPEYQDAWRRFMFDQSARRFRCTAA